MTMTDEEYKYLKKHVLNATGIDLDHYKSQQMRRRLNSFIEGAPVKTVADYCKVLEKDTVTVNKLRDFITINVTEFYRDTWAFEELATAILPDLINNSNNYLKIWSAGCSNGAEAYSVAMILREHYGQVLYRIIGTDVDKPSLERAKAGGPFRSELVRTLPQRYQKYLYLENNQCWVKPELRERVDFKLHNMLSDSFDSGFDLIVCRNVTIYFTNEAKDKLNRQFYASLKEKGVLFIGATEFIQDASQIGFLKKGPCFFKKGSNTIPASKQ